MKKKKAIRQDSFLFSHIFNLNTFYFSAAFNPSVVM